MKHIIALFLATASLHAESLIQDPTPPSSTTPEMVVPISAETSDKTFFTYFGIGGSGLGLPLMPEASFGCRKLHSHHVWDISAGGSPYGLVYGQVSYLYYPKPSSGFYLGAGLTGGYSSLLGSLFGNSPNYYKPYFNLPLSVGHQFANNNNYRFIQFQITPLLTTSISYGIGF